MHLVHDEDLVAASDRREAMRHHDAAAALLPRAVGVGVGVALGFPFVAVAVCLVGAAAVAAEPVVERRLHEPLTLAVESRGGLVEQADRRIAHDGARDREALLLPAGQLDAALAAVGLEPAREAPNELPAVGLPARRLDLRVRDHLALRARQPVGDVLTDGRREEDVVLRDHRDLPAQVVDVVVLEGGAVEEDLAGVGRVEALYELYGGALAAAGRADEGDLLAGQRREREPVQDLLLRLRREGEVHVDKVDAAGDGARRQLGRRARHRLDARLRVDRVADARERRERLDELRQLVREVAQAVLQVLGGHARLHCHPHRDEARRHEAARHVSRQEPRAGEHDDQGRDEEAVVHGAGALLDGALVLRARIEGLGLLLLHGKRAHSAQLLDHLVGVGDGVLGHLASALVEALHLADEEPLDKHHHRQRRHADEQ